MSKKSKKKKRDLIPKSRGAGRVSLERDQEASVRSLQGEMNRLFEEFSRGFALPRFGGLEAFAPDLDVEEDDDEIRIGVELPGVEEKDLAVSLRDGQLNVRGQKREERSGGERGERWTERRYGSFTRSIPLLCAVDEEKVEATFKRGVLEVKLPKSEEARRAQRHIEVRAG